MIDGLHLVRPDALWGFLLLPVVAWLLGHQRRRHGSWQQEIDPALLPYLVASPQQRQGSTLTQQWPLLLYTLAVLGAAGPSLQRADVPVFQRADALVIVLDLSDSMRARDIQPSRGQRAVQKVLDVLAGRAEGVTGLVAYAGDAHVVTPLTDDRRTIENLLPSLTPDIMPLPGSNAAAALREAIALITAAGMANGRILLLTDGMPRFDPAQFADTLRETNIDLAILGVGTAQGAPMPLPEGGFIRDDSGEIVVPVLDSAELRRIAEALGAPYRDVTLDDSDIQALTQPSVARLGEGISLDRRTDTWIDQGYWLVALLAAGLLPLFRRGVVALLLLALWQPAPTRADTLWDSLWSTPDQRGAAALRSGDAGAAANAFTDPAWRASAQFAAGDYAAAASGFAKINDADGHYNRGNALAMQGDLEGALAAYEQSLAMDPEREDAQANRELIQQLLDEQEAQQEQQQDPQQTGDPDAAPQDPGDAQSEDGANDPNAEQPPQQGGNQPSSDEANPQQRPEGDVAESEPGEGSEAMQEAMERRLEDETAMQMRKFDEALEEQQKLEQWLRRVPDEPGGLLRNKFRYQTIQRLRQGERPDEDIRW